MSRDFRGNRIINLYIYIYIYIYITSWTQARSKVDGAQYFSEVTITGFTGSRLSSDFNDDIMWKKAT